MSKFADLEIELHRRSAEEYAVDLRFTPPDGDAEVRLLRDKPGTVTSTDLAELPLLEFNSNKYGVELGKALFRDPLVAVAFVQAQTSAQSHDATLRVRLLLDKGAPELNDIRWECLRDLTGERLFTGEQIVFSRYLSSLDFRPARLRPQTQLKALVAIGNPSNLSDYVQNGQKLAPVDVESVSKRANAALSQVQITQIPASLDGIAERLRDGFDILYLVCHGALLGGEPKLWLEDATGRADRVTGSNFADRIRELSERPRLAVLASCDSAGPGRGGTASHLGALGPLLADAGVPAVLAMHGDLSMETESLFMPVFFRELLRDGRIDRAAAVARGAVRNRPDFWIPALYMRLKSGRLFVVDEDQTRRKWLIAAGATAALAAAGTAVVYVNRDRPSTGPLWNTEFLDKRPPSTGQPMSKVSYAPALAPAPDSMLLGVTLWRLRAAHPTEKGERILVLKKEMIPERVNAGIQVAEGDKMRLAVEIPTSGFLYVIDREQYSDGTFGDPYLIYPNRQTRPGDNELGPGRLIEIPDQRDEVNNFTIQSSRASQVAEVLSLVVSPQPLPELKRIDDTADTGTTKLDRAMYENWEKKWSAKADQLELQGGVGQVWTNNEKVSGADRKALLTRADAPPQNLYRVQKNSNQPVLLAIRIPFKK